MENVKSEKTNVIPLRSGHALFTTHTKKKLEDGIKTLSDKPADVVETFEQILCTQIVTIARSLVTALFTKLGEKTGRALVRQR